MADIARANLDVVLSRGASENRTSVPIHPAWLRLMRYCAELGHGEIEKLKIQDGLPMAAEVTTRKVKFSL
jgi:hypothetical protein